MPRNVEVKARVKDVDRLTKQVFKMTDSLGATLVQQDTFFHVPNGRLKLRVIDNSPDGELIFYDRPNCSGPTLSVYQKSAVDAAEPFKQTLSKALGVIGVVHKVRQLYLHGQTRIHIDQVDALGTFMELEVCLTEQQTVADGQRIAEEIMKQLDIPPSALESNAYLDLLTCAKQNGQTVTDFANAAPARAKEC